MIIQGINLNNDPKFCFIDLFYSPFKKNIKEELPLCETFPYTFDTNRTKSYYSNISLTDGINVNLEDVIKNINLFLNKLGNKCEDEIIVIFDNLSTISMERKKFCEQFNLVYNYCFENVI